MAPQVCYSDLFECLRYGKSPNDHGRSNCVCKINVTNTTTETTTITTLILLPHPQH